MTYVIAQPCVDVKDKACIEECPVGAIYYSDDVPDEWVDYVRANVEFFEEPGSPQGASALGNLARDQARTDS
jgi:ferredoxin